MIPQTDEQIRDCETLIRVIHDWIGDLHSITEVKMVRPFDNPVNRYPANFQEFRKLPMGMVYRSQVANNIVTMVYVKKSNRATYVIEI